MDLLESVIVITCILILGVKLYTVWRGKIDQASTLEPHKLKSPESDAANAAAADSELSEGDTRSKAAWDEAYLIVISMLLCGPLGLILLWRTDKWDSNTKMKLTMAYIGVVLLFMIFGLMAAWHQKLF